MKKMFTIRNVVSATTAAIALQFSPTIFAHHLLTGVNMMECELVLINSETDQLMKVPLQQLKDWKPASCQHTAISSDERTVYVTTDAVPPFQASIVTVQLKEVDWDNNTVNAKILQILPLDRSGSPARMPNVMQTSPDQPIMPWTRPLYEQTHAPTFLPHSKFMYITHYTDNRVRGFKILSRGKLDQKELYSDGKDTRQTHGVNFNSAGTIGLGVGYDYDMGEIKVYRANRKTGNVKIVNTIKFGTPYKYGAFAHYAVWIDDRYAYVGTMQQGPTSLTPPGAKVLGPSLWLVDTYHGTAKRVVGTASNSNEAGIFRSPSDVTIAQDKLYVAEEDSWGAKTDMPANYGRDGYVSIWDISEIEHPKFIKRLKPGIDLPADFRNAHTASATYDEDAVYVSSFVSNYVIKIDPVSDTVVKVYSKQDGLDMFHGEFAAGRTR